MALYAEVFRPYLVLETGKHEGFKWVIIRNQLNYRCGYVMVECNHPWFCLNYNDLDDVFVHGGLTFSDHGYNHDKTANTDEWWLGFDCGHHNDAPDVSLEAYGALFIKEKQNRIYHASGYGKVRDQDYVREECKRLCRQALRAIQALQD